ncbi:hypothetical protein IWW55_003891 [Coemansia sp. RSA 2706]|nr:hypothetical protein LPJ63_003587 [Coemansia sp. RSA 2711]KAJ1838811.1 hypothetical protein LPJ70_005314 [Coemansia sp. RSA 2708]KAJ2300733.1 hypothetical protein IWW55_003891 [Coemansia sp. RSA 2706]KAJ2311759.1 hypothetical protein IWW52_005047 [Coemansia sp. RSA 2704]KAJ2312561.1 hypothetical protein IWW54_002018 [Coemansia sp. RSA 2705]KAJ2323552.1 hypothetical protein IWW51_003702 [Coemansia sp. RSA 2702]KAJ2369646.1 hypothetical protein H4S01_000871 [Coemansia sp. RSA 2610]KAJ239155
MALTADSVLHKTLHDRFSSTRSTGERAVLALALQAFGEVQLRRQETLARVRELSLQIQRTESQLMRMHGQFFSRHSDSTLNVEADKYSLADIRVMDSLNAILGGHEARLRATKDELAAAEQRLATLVTTWATSKF